MNEKELTTIIRILRLLLNALEGWLSAKKGG